MRVGLFGGTFDPVHVGHLVVAEQCREQGRLDEVWFLPAPRPPHKDEGHITRFDQRVEMLQLAVAGHPAFRVEEIEKDRAGPSYTADTVAELRRRHPGHDFHLILGADSVRDLPGWHDPGRLVAQAGLLVAERPGVAPPSADDLRHALTGLPAGAPLRLELVRMPLIDLSSSDLRARVTAGHSVRYLVPRAVEMYVHEKGLYRLTESR
jgi:nicotinate-nucleotide adenylyltransferase